MSEFKLIHKNSRQLWHWNGILRISLAERSFFDISATSQYQGGKYILSLRISRLAHKKARFTEGSLFLGHEELTVLKFRQSFERIFSYYSTIVCQEFQSWEYPAIKLL